MSHGVPVVSGTTGWNAELPRAKAVCDAGEGTLLWSSNFSIGVNLFMALNKYLAAMMKPFPQYHVSMNEVHHIHASRHPVLDTRRRQHFSPSFWLGYRN